MDCEWNVSEDKFGTYKKLDASNIECNVTSSCKKGHLSETMAVCDDQFFIQIEGKDMKSLAIMGKDRKPVSSIVVDMQK
jgi:hypothetical protein